MKVGWLVMLVVALVNGAARAQSAPSQAAQPQAQSAQPQAQSAPPPAQVRESADRSATGSTKMSGHAANALAEGSSAQAAVLAEQALASDALNPWAHYRRAAALSDLHRTEEAVEEFKQAEQSFSATDVRGQSLALYGHANTLAQAGHCKEARPIFEKYASLVEAKDPGSAAQARSYARDCHER
jgi:tetratricopeptide (TPR) repeat protein